MKKYYLILIAFISFGKSYSQVLNQSAAWPNPGWTITGNYATTAIAFESNPTTTSNFAFDDDDAGGSHEDNIAAESPVIDLTAAHLAGETFIEVTVNYGFRRNQAALTDVLKFEYWNADTAAWVSWGANIPDNYFPLTVINNNFCTLPKTTYTSDGLNIASFTATQLSGFKYRISYNDNPAGTGWQWGFCFESPTIKSSTVAPVVNCDAVLTSPADGAVAAPLNGILQWSAATGSVSGYRLSVGTTPGGTNVLNLFDVGSVTTYDIPGSLLPEMQYYVKIIPYNSNQSATGCIEYSFTTTSALAGDFCSNAIDLNNLTSPLSSTTIGANNDNVNTCIFSGPITTNTHPDLYYFITVPNGSTVKIGQTVNNYDSSNVAFYGDCTNRTSLGCFDDPDDTKITWSNTTGVSQNVYWIQDGHSGSGTFTLEWSVIACVPPTATFAVNSLCSTGNEEYQVVTNVTSLGSATSVTVSDNQGNSQVTSVTGPVTLGPYSNGSPVTITVENDQDSNCTVVSSAQNQLACPPDNDLCAAATELTVNTDLLCQSVTPGTLAGATGLALTGDTCFGNANDDVWFSFEATNSSHRISILNVTPSTDMYHSLWTGTCGALTLVANSCSDGDTSNPSGLVPGQIYYVRVYSYSATASASTFNVCIGTPPPPPANDVCSAAEVLTVNTDLTCSSVTPGTLLSATGSALTGDTCLGNANDDVWFSFEATNATHRISILNVTPSIDMYHSLWTGSCGALTLVANSCSDGDTSNPVGLVPGQIYYVRVYSYSANPSSSTFNICIGTPPPPPANDNFANATVVSCDVVYTGNTSLATLDEDTAPDGGGADLDSKNVWFSYTGTGTPQTVTLSLCGSDYDTSVLVYTGTSGNLTFVAGNDDGFACGSTALDSRSFLNFQSDGVTTYYITVEGFNLTNTGNYSMDVSCAAVIPPAVANQTCALALSVPTDGTPINSDNSYGTINATQPSCDVFGSIQDVWFSFVAPASGSVECTIDNDTMTSSNFNIYSGPCSALVPITGTCNSNLATGGSEDLTGLIAGNTYYVQVWSSATEQGAFSITVTDEQLSVEQPNVKDFKAYPNPVKDILTVSDSKNIRSIEIFNLLGQQVTVKHINANEGQLDMSNLASGTYLVKVASEDVIQTIKIIKE